MLSALLLTVMLVISFGNPGDSPFALEVQGVLAAVQKPVTRMGNILQRGTQGVFGFRSLVDENQALTRRIAELEEEILDLQLSRAELEELKTLTGALNYTAVQESKFKIASGIISMDGSSPFNIFTIDAGLRSGVVKEAVVVNELGLIGRVSEVGPRFGKVISVTDTNTNFSFRIYKSDTEHYLGIASGDGRGGLTGYMLDADARIALGDRLVTSGMGVYPAGLIIGTVSDIADNRETLLKTIDIEPAVDFDNLSTVLVIVTKDLL
jgi:rod shape-determining protein MreC